MKIRLDRESLRVRLTRKEVVQFAQTRFLEECVELSPGRKLAFTLEEKAENSVEWNGERIRIFIASASAAAQTENLRAGISFKTPLEITIEEDLHS